MDAGTGLEDRPGGRIVELAQAVDERTAGVDDAARANVELIAADRIAHARTADLVLVFEQRQRFDVVGDHRAVLLRSQRQRHRHPRVVELAVVIDDAGFEAVGLEHRIAAQRLVAADQAAVADAFLAGHQVVEQQAGIDVGHLEPVVDWRHQRDPAGQVRRVVDEGAAFVEAFLDQVVLRAVELLDRHFEVTHAAVDQLGAAAAGAFGEVVLVDQGDGKAAAGRVDGDAAAGRATADDEQVERSLLLQGIESLLSVHDYHCSNYSKWNVIIVGNKQMF